MSILFNDFSSFYTSAQTDSPESKLEGPDDSDDSDDSDEDPSPDDNMNDKGNDESQPPIPVICVKSPVSSQHTLKGHNTQHSGHTGQQFSN